MPFWANAIENGTCETTPNPNSRKAYCLRLWVYPEALYQKIAHGNGGKVADIHQHLVPEGARHQKNIGDVVQQHGGHRDVFDHIAVQHPPAGALCLLLQHWQHFLFWGFTAAAVIFPA